MKHICQECGKPVDEGVALLECDYCLSKKED